MRIKWCNKKLLFNFILFLTSPSLAHAIFIMVKPSEETQFGVKIVLNKHTNQIACPKCSRIMKNNEPGQRCIIFKTNFT
ncbi:hypothetical protein BpHYR1_018735 [Brachionus plicatilis]|uniref:LITAF domain-containing protein n=1 Tax=Brachionus plicatilis TaxID=10195 RepID=A0A3M7QA72_BRAPC|nr:hypothetical protein BpHYR1_018735 [Brachionus plicatilis]